jgi:hypothetical protein
VRIYLAFPTSLGSIVILSSALRISTILSMYDCVLSRWWQVVRNTFAVAFSCFSWNSTCISDWTSGKDEELAPWMSKEGLNYFSTYSVLTWIFQDLSLLQSKKTTGFTSFSSMFKKDTLLSPHSTPDEFYTSQDTVTMLFQLNYALSNEDLQPSGVQMCALYNFNSRE